MNRRALARVLGRRGGQARAKRLSADVRKKIASMGGHARAQSLKASRYVADNFRYLKAMRELSGSKKRGPHA